MIEMIWRISFSVCMGLPPIYQILWSDLSAVYSFYFSSILDAVSELCSVGVDWLPCLSLMRLGSPRLEPLSHSALVVFEAIHPYSTAIARASTSFHVLTGQMLHG